MSIIDLELGQQSPAITEGSTTPGQQAYLTSLVQGMNAEWVAEIGMNAGVSARTMLGAKPDIAVHSFDIAEHPYIFEKKVALDRDFPGRHELVVGDSRETVPEFPGSDLFDLVFIDGGHEYNVARCDILNMARLVKPRGVVVIDDITPWNYTGKGPTKALLAMMRRGVLDPTSVRFHSDKPSITDDVVSRRRVWATARYTADAAAKAPTL